MIGTRAEYARHRKCKPPYITKLIRLDKIPVRPDGKIDFEKADAALARVSGGTMRRNPGKAGSNSASRSYTEQRTISEKYTALIKQLEYEERSGRLIDKASVLKAQASAYSVVRARLRAMWRSLAPVVTTMSPREAENMGLETTDKILDALSKNLFDKKAADES